MDAERSRESKKAIARAGLISLHTPNPNLWAPKQQIPFVTLRSEKPYLEIVSCSQGCLEMKALAQGPAESVLRGGDDGGDQNPGRV